MKCGNRTVAKPMNITTPTSPTRISTHITAFCKEIDPTKSPVFLPLQLDPQSKPDFCYENVRNYVALHAGDIQHGWIIWELPDVFLQAEFHAVRISPVGELIDITPKVDGENKILFLPDSKRVYNQNLLVESRLKPFTYNKATWYWMWTEHEKHKIKQKHFWNGKVNVQAANAELDFLNSTEEGHTPKINRNASCICGSGKKFKRCCISNDPR